MTKVELEEYVRTFTQNWCEENNVKDVKMIITGTYWGDYMTDSNNDRERALVGQLFLMTDTLFVTVVERVYDMDRLKKELDYELCRTFGKPTDPEVGLYLGRFME